MRPKYLRHSPHSLLQLPELSQSVLPQLLSRAPLLLQTRHSILWRLPAPTFRRFSQAFSMVQARLRELLPWAASSLPLLVPIPQVSFRLRVFCPAQSR